VNLFRRRPVEYRIVNVALTPKEQSEVEFYVTWNSGVFEQDTGLEMSEEGKHQLRQNAIQIALDKRGRRA
jgi:hypothetical protein